MANQVTRRTLERWLSDHGYAEALPRRSGGHAHYVHPSRPGKVTVCAHGPLELTRAHLASITRALARAGFDRARTATELRAGAWEIPASTGAPRAYVPAHDNPPALRARLRVPDRARAAAHDP